MSGSDEIDPEGQIFLRDEPNMPPSRGYALGWTDIHGNLWLFGGSGASKTKEYFRYEFCLGGYRNDLWMYDGENWTWMSGSTSADQPGSYGDKGVASASNVPGARCGAIGWRDNEGNLWMFGGTYVDQSSGGI
jgi:hypothetical protein